MKRKGKGSISKEEAKVCRRIGGVHIGGPGYPDCITPKKFVEIKRWKKPLRPYDVRKIARKYKYRLLLICAPIGGYTAGAQTEAKRLKVELSRCAPRRKKKKT